MDKDNKTTTTLLLLSLHEGSLSQHPQTQCLTPRSHHLLKDKTCRHKTDKGEENDNDEIAQRGCVLKFSHRPLSFRFPLFRHFATADTHRCNDRSITTNLENPHEGIQSEQNVHTWNSVTIQFTSTTPRHSLNIQEISHKSKLQKMCTRENCYYTVQITL